MCDGTSQPASAAMAEETADWYVGRVAGQLKKVQRGRNWYLAYAALPGKGRNRPHEPGAARDADMPRP